MTEKRCAISVQVCARHAARCLTVPLASLVPFWLKMEHALFHLTLRLNKLPPSLIIWTHATTISFIWVTQQIKSPFLRLKMKETYFMMRFSFILVYITSRWIGWSQTQTQTKSASGSIKWKSLASTNLTLPIKELFPAGPSSPMPQPSSQSLPRIKFKMTTQSTLKLSISAKEKMFSSVFLKLK